MTGRPLCFRAYPTWVNTLKYKQSSVLLLPRWNPSRFGSCGHTLLLGADGALLAALLHNLGTLAVMALSAFFSFAPSQAVSCHRLLRGLCESRIIAYYD
jgi:hypothetical protein